jgi:hypothetical protein
VTKPLPRKLDFVCTLLDPPKSHVGLGLGLSGFGVLLAVCGAEFVGDVWAALALRVTAAVLAIIAVMLFSRDSSTFDNQTKVHVEVGLDGLRLPMQAIPFRRLQSIRVDSSPSNHSTIELLLDDGESLKLSMLDAEPVARLIRERHQLFKRLTVPRARARADGYRGVRIAEEAESIEDGVRHEEWAEENLEAVLASALVVPANER